MWNAANPSNATFDRKGSALFILLDRGMLFGEISDSNKSSKFSISILISEWSRQR